MKKEVRSKKVWVRILFVIFLALALMSTLYKTLLDI